MISSNATENAVRPVTLGGKTWLFAGSDAGEERAAIIYTLIRTGKINGLEPEAGYATFSSASASIQATNSTSCFPGI